MITFLSNFRVAWLNKLSRKVWRIAPEFALRGSAAMLALFAVFGFNPQALAAADTWVGNTSVNWADSNWAAGGNNPPATGGDSLVFGAAGTAGAALTDNLMTTATYTVNGITFNSGASAFTINPSSGNGFTLNGNIVDNSTNLETINDAIAQTGTDLIITNPSGGNLTFGGIISNATTASGITVAGGGTVTLNAADTYTGGTVVNAGTLNVNASVGGSISASSVLTLGGGELSVTGLTSTQAIASTTLTSGNDTVNVTGGTGTVNLNTVTYNVGATLELIGPSTDTSPTTSLGQSSSGDVSATGIIESTLNSVGTGSANGDQINGSTTGIVRGGTAANDTRDAFATVGLYDYAVTVADGSEFSIIGGSQGTGGTTGDGAYTLVTNGAVGGGTQPVDVVGTDTIAVSSLDAGIRFNAAGAATLNTSSTVSFEGLLVTPNVGNANITIGGAAGFQPGLRSGSNGGSISMIQNNTLGYLDINTVIYNLNSLTSTIVQSGAGTVDYTVANTYLGSFYLDEGTAEISADSGLGNQPTGATTFLNGGTIVGAASFALDNSGANARPVALGGNGGGLGALTGDTMTVDGLVSGGAGTGPLVIGIPASAANDSIAGEVPGSGTGAGGATTANAQQLAIGTVVLSDVSNTYTGGTVIDSGVLQLTGTMGELGSGGITLNGGTFQWGAGNTTDISTRTITLASNGTFDTQANNPTLAHSIGNGGAGGFTKLGSGTLTLNGNNTFTGAVTLSAGNLTLGGANIYSGATAVNAGTLTLNSGSSLGNTAITVAGSATLAVNPGSSTIQIGSTAGSLDLAAGSTLSLADGATGVLVLNNAAVSTANTVLTLGGTSSNPDNLTFDVESTGADEILVNDGTISLSGTGTDITLNTGTTAPSQLTLIPLLSIPNGSGTPLALTDFDLITTTITSFTGGDYSASLSLNGAGDELYLNLAPAVVNLNFYWTGNTSSSWATIANFATDTTGTQAQTGSFNASSNVFETATSPTGGTYTQTLGGTYTINSLTFTGVTSNSVSLQSGTLDINASTSFEDTNTSNSYASGIGLVVEAGSVANNIGANIILNHTQTWEIDNSISAPLTVSGVIGNGAGSDGLIKTGLGTLILSGSNTYSGGTTVYGGTLALGGNNALLSTGALTVSGTGSGGGASAGKFDLAGFNQTVGSISDGGTNTGIITASTGASTFTINGGGTFSGAITGGVALTEAGSSTLTLSGSNSYTGLTTVTGGTLISATNSALGSSTSATGGLFMDPSAGTATADFTSSVPSIASLASAGAGASGVVLGNDITDTSTTLTVGGGGQMTIFGGSISDLSGVNGSALGNLVLSGGSLSLNAADTFIGTTIVTSGTLTVGNVNALEKSTVNYNNQGGTLNFASGVTAATFGALEGDQNLALTNLGSGVVALNIGNNGATGAYSGVLSGGGSLTVAGGAVTLSGSNTYTGTTTLTSGTTSIASTGAIGNAVTPSGAIGETGGVFDVGGSIYTSSITQAAGSAMSITAGSVNVSGLFAVNSNDADLNGLVSITGGTVTANSMTIGRDGVTTATTTAPTLGLATDGVYVNGGTLAIATTLTFGPSTGAASVVNFREDSGSVTVGGTTFISDNNAGRWATLDVNGGVFTSNDTTGAGIEVGVPTAAPYTGSQSELLVSGGTLNTDTITLGSPTQTSGQDEFQALGGTTNIGSGGIVSGNPVTTTLLVNIGNSAAATAPTIAASASWSSSLPITLSNSSGAMAPTFRTASGANITLSGNISGAGGMTAAGTGILTLSGAASYSGATTVSGGALVLSGSITGTSSTSIATGANLEVDGLLTSTSAAAVSGELSGVGIVTNGATLTAGEIAAGDTLVSTAVGTLTSAGNITLDNASTLSFRIGLNSTTDADQLALTGAAALSLTNSLLQITVGSGADSPAALDQLYVIVNGGAGSTTGSGSDSFANAPFNGTNYVYTNPSGSTFDVFYGVDPTNTTTGSDIDVELVAVPEPGAWASLLGGIGMLVGWQRNRRRR